MPWIDHTFKVQNFNLITGMNSLFGLLGNMRLKIQQILGKWKRR